MSTTATLRSPNVATAIALVIMKMNVRTNAAGNVAKSSAQLKSVDTNGGSVTIAGKTGDCSAEHAATIYAKAVAPNVTFHATFTSRMRCDEMPLIDHWNLVHTT